MNKCDMLDEAIIVATKAHQGQTDKVGQPYILHPLRVMLKVPSFLRVPAVLHDVIEDTLTTEDDLVFVGGKNLRIIKALTRLDGERYFDYVNRLAKDSDAVKVKLADLEDNMAPERMIGMEKPWGLMERYSKTYHILSNLKL
jgi:(p)ppGpp synthase/HD superfamily hydrolase